VIDGLRDAVDAASWSALLPRHRLEVGEQPVGPPRHVDALELSDLLALVIARDDRGQVYPVPAVLARDGDGQVRGVRRALPGDGAAEALIALLTPGTSQVAGSGRRFRMTGWHRRDAAGERPIPVDQTNESVIAGRAVVKWASTADPGPHPAPSLLAELDAAGFTGMPIPWGVLEWSPEPGAAPRLVALVVDHVANAEDGWTWAVDDIRAAAAAADPTIAGRSGEAVGALVADFHRALAGTARPATDREAACWRSSALSDLDAALAVTTGAPHDQLAAAAATVRARFADVPIDAGQILRVHGDLHVGQVLAVAAGRERTYQLTDFDGNPVVSPEERAAPQPAATDVAGMAQSFVHAGLVVSRHHPDLDRRAVTTAAETARDTFLDAYRAGLGGHRYLLDDRLLVPFALRQVCREFSYAARHLPRWSYVPEGALPMLLSTP
jgi:maltokinase